MTDIISVFERNKKTYDAYSKSLESLLVNILSSEGIKTHSITSRVKERKSLENKIETKDNYSCIEDITDIVGLRIITHYADEVDSIADIIKKEFDIDLDNSIDKREAHEPDRFGYLSLHYIVSLKGDRTKLSEYKRFKNIKAELQIRSILQHTWAEIEHDIGYKSEIGVPREIKRQFSRLAGLLEIGDSEFINIRDSLNSYADEVEKNLKISAYPIPLDKISLIEYSKKSKILNELVKISEDSIGMPISSKIGKNVDFALKNLIYANIKTINELENELIKNKNNIIKKCKIVAERRRNTKNALPREILFVYLVQALMVINGGEELVNNYISTFRKGSKDNLEFAQELLQTFSA